MTVTYDSKTDLLYIRLDQSAHTMTNRRVDGDVVLDIDEKGEIAGIEIMDASRNIQLDIILPVDFKKAS